MRSVVVSSGVLAAACVVPFVVTDVYMMHLVVLTTVFGLLALSLDVIVGHMGQFSFGHQAFFGVAAYTTAILTVKADISPWVGFVAGISAALILGVAVAAVALHRTRGVYLGIVTLGVGSIVALIARNWFSLTGGLTGIASIPYLTLGEWATLDTEHSYYYFALLLLAVSVFTIRVWSRSRLGRAVSAVRENEILARAVGINPYRYYVAAFTLSAGLAGVAGVTYAHFTTHVAPLSLSLHYMFWMLVMVIVGGVRTVAGPIVGAFIVVFVPEWLLIAEEFRTVALGVVLLVCIVLMPQGVVPASIELVRRSIRRVRTRRGGTTSYASDSR